MFYDQKEKINLKEVKWLNIMSHSSVPSSIKPSDLESLCMRVFTHVRG